MALAVSIIGWVLVALSAIGSCYMFAAAIVFSRFFARRPPATARQEGITLLKPLYGAEPRLAANLATFLAQDHDGPIQLLCGVHSAHDPAIAAVEALRAAYPDAHIDLVVDPTLHGSNGKVGNLINLAPHIAHETIVLSDSDMAVGRDYCARILDALDAPGVGGVTLLYHGRGDAGFWSRLGACGLSWQFFPSATFGVATGLASPSMGSTIALRRATLDAIHGFAPFADVLADDYALGEAIRGQGLAMAVPAYAIAHGSAETSLGELWRHELRWGATVRDVVPAAYAAALIGIPLPLALLALPFHPEAGLVALGVALLVRLAIAMIADQEAGRRTAPLWLLPLRDCFTLAVFVGSFFVRSVDWRGAVLKMEQHGRVSAGPETSIP
jgi:ceramide glucosyltransferase